MVTDEACASLAVTNCTAVALEGAIHGAEPFIMSNWFDCLGGGSGVGVVERVGRNKLDAVISPIDIRERWGKGWWWSGGGSRNVVSCGRGVFSEEGTER